jgi:ADP-ribose pyrophosphatase YjhB (NUDIX family)
MIRDAFCNYCGTKYAEPLAYPRTCASCKAQVWSNPIPVSVVIVPIVDRTAPPFGGDARPGQAPARDGARTGVLAIRRNIPPGVGMLALVGGFLEDHETWQAGGAREVMEETGIAIDPRTIEPLWWSSSEPKPNRVLLFGVAAKLELASLAPFAPNSETQERGLVYGPDGLDKAFVFSTHIEAARRYFAREGITGPHAFAVH